MSACHMPLTACAVDSRAERLPTYFLLLQQVELVALHAKVLVIIQQGLCARVRVITGHDDHLKLHWLSTLRRSLALQCQDAFDIHLHHRASAH